MAFIPYEHITLRSHLSPEAAWWTLAAVVEPQRDWPFGKPRQHRPPNNNTKQSFPFQRSRVMPAPKHPVLLHFSKKHLPYLGMLDGYKFEIGRIIRYRHSFLFLAAIKGEILPEGSGSSITIIMHPPIITIVSLVGLGVGGGFIILSVVLGSLYAALRSHGPSGLSLSGLLQICVFVAAFSLFVYLLVILPFNYESRKSIAFFQGLFET